MEKIIFTVFIIFITCASKAGELSESIRQFFKDMPESLPCVIYNEYLFAGRELQMFYMNRMYAPAWINQNTPFWFQQNVPVWNSSINIGKNGLDLVDYIRQVDQHGLLPMDYHLDLIEKYIAKIWSYIPMKNEDQMKLDILLSDAYMLLSSHLFYGKVDAKKEGGNWKMQRKEPKIRSGWKLENALAANDMNNHLELLSPHYPSYWLMKNELTFFLQLNKQSWPVFLSGSSIKQGESNELIPKIRERLIKLRHLLSDSVSIYYDEGLEKQVKLFQVNWGMNSDGVIGQGTLDILNSAPYNLINKLRANMERFRWLPLQATNKHIIVNIANFMLDMVEGKDTLISMRAIVGKEYRETPVFNALMTYIVFSPSWTVPPTILQNDVIPELLKGPEYLVKKNMKLLRSNGSEIEYRNIDWSKITKNNFSYMVRQDPGPENALGRVKFIFPNSYNVYIHDTPTKGFFARDNRALSSGCIRIEKPFELAISLLSDMPEWTPTQIRNAMQQNKEQIVRLKTPVDVVIIYLTAWISGNRQIQFRKDVYKRDEMVIKALNQILY